MPRGPLSEEQKAAMAAGRERARAAREAAKIEGQALPVAPVATVPTNRAPGGLNKGEYLPLPSRARESAYFRSRKIVKAECKIPDVQTYNDKTQVSYTTGPCQQEIVHNPMKQFDWFKTCTHGPEYDSQGQPIPPHERPYYEQATEFVRRPKSVGNDGRVEWEDYEILKVQLRISDVSLDKRHMTGKAMAYWQDRGARSVESFGIRTYCDYRGCFSQDLKTYANGNFCSRRHAALVRIYERGKILHIPWDRLEPGEKPSYTAREQAIAEEAV